jgi:hypothetical protein
LQAEKPARKPGFACITLLSREPVIQPTTKEGERENRNIVKIARESHGFCFVGWQKRHGNHYQKTTNASNKGMEQFVVTPEMRGNETANQERWKDKQQIEQSIEN